MLIIFDLDDTLIDTSGSITPYRLERAFSRMVEAGLNVGSFSDALEELKQLNASSLSARHALRVFLERHSAPPNFLEIGVQEVYENPLFEMPIFPTKGALELLKLLKKEHSLALVSIGRHALQMEKMKKAGIDSAIFSKIAVCEGNKKLYYSSIVEELKYSSSEVLVCGDKVEVDLSPAKELGYKTIHFRSGRGLNSTQESPVVDYTITQLEEIKQIL